MIAMLVGPLAAATVVPALAQSNPTTNQIIQSLTPSGNVPGGTRGIRLVNPGAQATPAAPPSATYSATPPPATHSATVTHRPRTPPSSPTEATAPSVSLNVDFATNSAVLTPEAKTTLDQLGQALASKDLATYRFRIEGHTDTVGSPGYNMALSQRRANAVAAYLEQTFNIPPSRLEAVGRGQQGLLVVTPPQTAELRNRRVAVINLGT
jgi:OmpA-OmpF porin, OOP family